jgi:phosphoribosyl-AMP cyclohydrolase
MEAVGDANDNAVTESFFSTVECELRAHRRFVSHAEARMACFAMTAAAILDEIAFDADGVVPAIALQHDSGEVLMLAWMSRDAVAETLATGRVCYSSRGRGKLWRKGEISGQTQRP